MNIPGLPTDFQHVFEDYIDNYGTFEGTFTFMKGWAKANGNFDLTKNILDRFCLLTYNMDYKSTFLYLNNFTNNCMRKAIDNLARDGNAKALDIAAQHFMKLGQEQNKNNARIIINANISGVDDNEE